MQFKPCFILLLQKIKNRLAEHKPFQFKQFTVGQAGCTMKVNTDGVLLGACAGNGNLQSILDIGTGTGVIALMLAQRFTHAQIDAVEIDPESARTAQVNFEQSPFHERLQAHALSFQEFSKQNSHKKYDLIAGNPPFFLNSLRNSDKRKETARHAEGSFFADLISFALSHLNPSGKLSLILPPQTAFIVLNYARDNKLFLHHQLEISSFEQQPPHRFLITLGFEQNTSQAERFNIYQEPDRYSEQYKKLLSDFLTIF